MRLKIIIVIQLLIISQIYAHCAEINFIYTSNLGGEIESCGCSGSGITGLAKRNTLVSTIKTEQSIHLECGDAFFRKHTIPEDEISQKKLKAKFTRDCLDLSKIDAYIPGDRDFAAGSDFLFDELIPKMKTSTLAANIGMTKCKAINKSGLKILLVGLCQGPTKSTKAWTSEKLAVKDLVSSLRSVIDGQEKTADLIIAIVHGKREDIERIAKAKLANIIIDGSGRESPKEPETIGGTIIVAAPRDGRFIGQLTLKSEKWARGEIEFSNKYISVSSKLKDDPEISALIAQYKNELIKLYSSETRKWKKPSKPTYWFDNVCGYCHPDQMDFWKTTRHAKAIKTLEKRKAHMDKECIGCHTIGFKKEGGWTHPIHLKTFANVQCEVCHAPGALHKKGTLILKPSKYICQKCHDNEHDPNFDYDKDILKIRCPDSTVKKIMADGKALRQKQEKINHQPGSVSTILGRKRRGGLRPVQRRSLQ